MKFRFFLFVLSILLFFAHAGKDYYDLLGIKKGATDKDIRKAFKKLALEHHPDKNQDDPNAHDKFIEINRAYEVLKDDELRKKYDLHGEAGLNDNHQRGQQYQSWNFYQNDFGIYDDDPEIITLSQSDFEQSVLNSDDIWFVNFYSPQCGHCHELAPTWRQVAKELEGVIRIGAMNCMDSWQICNMQGIRGYPSLILYPKREKYQGERSREEIIQYAMRDVKINVIHIHPIDYDSEIRSLEVKSRHWLISFCDIGEDEREIECMNENSLRKVTAMLKNVVNVALVECVDERGLCAIPEHGDTTGVWFFESTIEKGQGHKMQSMDAKELAMAILGHLPDVVLVDDQKMESIMTGLVQSTERPWLIQFVNDLSQQDLELRKLPALLDNFNVGKVDCTQSVAACQRFTVYKYPSFAILKQGGGHEFHYGRATAHDVIAFVKENFDSPMINLGPDHFPLPVMQSGNPWVVDFFAPWCPPCMKLLPEFRKASKAIVADQVRAGIVDCTQHGTLCQQYNVHSYPTMIMYNKSIPHSFQGQHAASDVIAFVQDTLRPSIVDLDAASFETLVNRKPSNELVMVDFFAPWCGPCMQFAPEWRKVAKMMGDSARVLQIDCVANKDICDQQSIRGFPTIRLYPPGSAGSRTFQTYNGWMRDAPNVRAWAYQFLPSDVITLTGGEFEEKVLGDDGPWLVDFWAPWCGHCHSFAPEFESVAKRMKKKIKAGKVDCVAEQGLCGRMGLRAFPTLKLYMGKKNQPEQTMNGIDIENIMNSDIIVDHLQRNFASILTPSLTTSPPTGGHDEF